MPKKDTNLKKRAQDVFNAWIRARDSQDGYFTCISCQKTLPTSKMNAGHYVPVKNHSIFRYHEDNVHGECAGCNGFDEFHLVGYRKNLINKIGLERVEYLENNRNAVKKWSEEELKKIIKNYGGQARKNIEGLL